MEEKAAHQENELGSFSPAQQEMERLHPCGEVHDNSGKRGRFSFYPHEAFPRVAVG